MFKISACKTASARKVIAVIPCFPYSRQRTISSRNESEMLIDLPNAFLSSSESIAMEDPTFKAQLKNLSENIDALSAS